MGRMVNDVSSAPIAPTDETWDEIERLVGELAVLAQTDVSPAEFHAALLDRTVRGLAAVAGAVWVPGSDLSEDGSGALRLDRHIDLAETGLIPPPTAPSHRGEAAGADVEAHLRLLRAVVQSGEAKLVPPRSALPDAHRTANPTEFLLILCPFAVEGDRHGVVEVFQRPDVSRAAQHGSLRFVATVCELAGQFHRNTQLRTLRGKAAVWDRFEQFCAHVHGSLDLQATAYAIANEGRSLLNCDRLSVAVYRGTKSRLLAVSGLDTVNRRANLVRRLEKLVDAVLAVKEPLWYADEGQGTRDEGEISPLNADSSSLIPHPSSTLPPQIGEPLQTLLDESHARALAVIPLHRARSASKGLGDPGEARQIGALILEQFEGNGSDEGVRNRIEPMRRHSSLALSHALAYRAVPLMPVWRGLQTVGTLLLPAQLPKTVPVALAVVAAVLALVFVPADFNIEGRGELQPVVRHEVFAGSDGVVDELRVKQGERVSAGEVLVVLRRSELDFEFSRVLGELQTTRKRLAGLHASRALRASRAGPSRNDPNALERYQQLTAEEEELKEQLKSLQQQFDILQAQRDELLVKSPIDGQVLTWNVKQRLQARPVKRGQVLLTVANPDGPWEVEMHVDDDDVGYVLDAQRELGSPLDVTFLLATDPDVVCRGRVENIALTTQREDAEKEPAVRITVAFERGQVPRLRPGATVVPKIYCGRRAIGYVWLHDLIDAGRTWLLF